MNPSRLQNLTVPVSTISRCDRWQAYQRLQELGIACQCSSDGGLRVEIYSPTSLLQIRSVAQQLTLSRTELLSWLERCWHNSIVSLPNHSI